jgi:hypothetical protein
MLDIQYLQIAGMKWMQGFLWFTCPAESLVGTFEPTSRNCEAKLTRALAVDRRRKAWTTIDSLVFGKQ